MNLALRNHCTTPPAAPGTALDEYGSVRRAVAFIWKHWRAQPSIEAMAAATGLPPEELHLLFRRWAGQTPKAFMQAVTLLRFLDDCRETAGDGVRAASDRSETP